jgi:hypothetical protein
MPLQNRVTPLSELIADPARGLVYGNRGCLHDDEGRIVRRWATKLSAFTSAHESRRFGRIARPSRRQA